MVVVAIVVLEGVDSDVVLIGLITTDELVDEVVVVVVVVVVIVLVVVVVVDVPVMLA